MSVGVGTIIYPGSRVTFRDERNDSWSMIWRDRTRVKRPDQSFRTPPNCLCGRTNCKHTSRQVSAAWIEKVKGPAPISVVRGGLARPR